MKWICVHDLEPAERIPCLTKDKEGTYQVAWKVGKHWQMFNSCCTYNSQLNDVEYWMLIPEVLKEE